MKVSLLLISSVLWGSHTLNLLTLAEEEVFEYVDQEEESYLYYYEDESITTSKTSEKKTTPTITTETSTPPLVVQKEVETPPPASVVTPKRKNDHSITLIPSGFAPKPRDDDDDETSNVTPLWDNEPYMLEVKASYGCIMEVKTINKLQHDSVSITFIIIIIIIILTFITTTSPPCYQSNTLSSPFHHLHPHLHHIYFSTMLPCYQSLLSPLPPLPMCHIPITGRTRSIGQ